MYNQPYYPTQQYPQGAAPPQGYPAAGYPPQQAAYPPPQGGGYYQQQPAPPMQPNTYFTPPPMQQQYPPQQQYKPPAPAAPKPNANYYAAADIESGQAAAAASKFAEQKIRQGFIRKVLLIVFVQLCITVGIASCFMFIEPVKDYVGSSEGQWVFLVSWVMSLAMLITLMCNEKLRKKHPYNLLALIAFTLVYSVQIGVICAYWDVAVVLEAFAVTTATVLGLSLAAFCLPFDLTKHGNVLGIIGICFFFASLMTFFVGFFYVSTWWYLVISVIGAVLFSLYLVYDLQKLMGGKKGSMSPDEYVFASVQIYLDIVLIFLYILQIIGMAQR